MHQPRDRQLQRVARGLVRSVLSHYLPSPPESWRFDHDASGRPYVPGMESRIDFNISHTRGLVAVAVTCGYRIGVDVEWLGPLPAPDVADAIFSPDEHRAWSALPTETERHARLLTLWTLKEACVKASGAGLTYPVKRLSFELDHPGAPCLSASAELQERRFASWREGPAHQMALCLEGAGVSSGPLVAAPDAPAPGGLPGWPPGACQRLVFR